MRMGEYIIITSNIGGEESLDTAFCFYQEGKIHTLAYLSKTEVEKGYAEEYMEGTQVAGGANVYNIAVEEYSQVVAAVLQLCQTLYDFEDHSIMVIWDAITEDILNEIEDLASAGEGADTRIQFTKFKDFITGVFDLENLYINHGVNDTLYEDDSDVVAINLAQSELLIAIQSRE